MPLLSYLLTNWLAISGVLFAGFSIAGITTYAYKVQKNLGKLRELAYNEAVNESMSIHLNYVKFKSGMLENPSKYEYVEIESKSFTQDFPAYYDLSSVNGKATEKEYYLNAIGSIIHAVRINSYPNKLEVEFVYIWPTWFNDSIEGCLGPKNIAFDIYFKSSYIAPLRYRDKSYNVCKFDLSESLRIHLENPPITPLELHPRDLFAGQFETLLKAD